jgi:hypothetical protein
MNKISCKELLEIDLLQTSSQDLQLEKFTGSQAEWRGSGDIEPLEHNADCPQLPLL